MVVRAEFQHGGYTASALQTWQEMPADNTVPSFFLQLFAILITCASLLLLLSLVAVCVRVIMFVNIIHCDHADSR